MAAANYDFISDGCDGAPLEIAATFSYQFVWQAETTPGSGIYQPVNITGYSAKMQVRKKPGATVELELSTVNGRITLDGPNGIINLFVPASVTTTLTADIFKYDLDLVDANGFVTRFIQGSIEFVGAITE